MIKSNSKLKKEINSQKNTQFNQKQLMKFLKNKIKIIKNLDLLLDQNKETLTLIKHQVHTLEIPLRK